MPNPSRSHAFAAAAACVATCLIATPSRAAVGDLYAATGAGGGAGFCAAASLSNLYTIDPDTAAATLVAPIEIDDVQVRHVSALAFHPTTGVLYGVMNVQVTGVNCDQSTLLTIDPATGAATIVGTYGSILGPIPDIAFDPYGKLYAWSEFGDELLVIDITDGSYEQVESSSLGTSATGLASDSQGRLFLKSGSYLTQLNQYTAQNFNDTFLDRGAHDMLAFDANDVLYSAQRIEGGLALFTIDMASFGTTTEIGTNSVPNISALTFNRGIVTPPPVSDLSIAKEADDASPEQGTNIVFTLTLTNDGPDAADNVVVEDVLPTNFTFVSASGDGTYDDNQGEWSVSSVAASSSASIDITATATFGGDYVNSAEIVASDSYDPDSVIGSGDLESDIYAEVSDSVLRRTLFSIDSGFGRLWVTDPMFERFDFDMAQDIELDNDTVCGGEALARQPETGELFAVLKLADCITQRLVTIDPVTALATNIGGFGDVLLTDIAFGGSQETLYATSGAVGGSQPNTLFTVDPTDASLTPECTLQPTEYGRALAYHEGNLYDAALVCDPNCNLTVFVIDTTSLPADPADPCPIARTVASTLPREPTGLTFTREGADFVEFHLASNDEIYDLNIQDVGSPGYVFRQYLSHNSDGLAFAVAATSIGNLEATKTAAKQRVKGDKFITYTLAATNTGPDPINGILLTDPVPTGTTVTALGSGCSEVGGVVSCDAGFVDADSTEFYSFTVQVTCKKCSSIANSVSIATDMDAYDNPFDNTQQIITSIKGKF